MQLGEIKKRLMRALQGLTDAHWDYLLERGYPQEVESGAAEMSSLIREGQALLELARPGHMQVTGSERQNRNSSARHDVLSQLLVEHARTNEEVRRFRDAHLLSGLLVWADVVQWVQRQAEQSGVPTRYATMALIEDDSSDGFHLPTPDSSDMVPAWARGYRSETIKFFGPGDEWARFLATTKGTPLDRLRMISENLAKRYPWTEAQAVVFVLTDVVPEADQLSVTTPDMGPIFDGYEHPWMKRIVLRVDPVLGPQEVEAAYRRARKQVLGNRYRTPTEKHLRLASFVGQAPDDEKWLSRMHRWNTEYPRWRYEHCTNFRRDAFRAQQRVLDPASLPGNTRLRPATADPWWADS